MESNYGKLFHESDIKLHRQWFTEMVKLWGIQVSYQAPLDDKHYTTYGEIKSNYYEPIKLGVLFDEHPDQRTMKKIGWDNLTDTNAVVITIPYDTPHIQVGALFLFPAAIDGAEPKLYRAIELSTKMIYPATIMCKCVPEYTDTYVDSDNTFKYSSQNLVGREEDGDI